MKKKLWKVLAKIFFDILFVLLFICFLLFLLYFLHGSLEQFPTGEQQEKARTAAALGMFASGVPCLIYIIIRIKLYLSSGGHHDRRRQKNVRQD